MNKLRAAVVGLNFGGWVIDNELIAGSGRDYFDVYAVCDLNKAKVAEFAERYQAVAYYDYDAVLNDPLVDVVILITGPAGRSALIDMAINKGKPVMTTKPFDNSLAETLRVLNKAKSLDIPVFMNSPTPLPANELLQISDWIREFNLGRPVGYRATTWCSYREEPDGSWYDDPILCPAAPIYRLGVYLLNDLQRFFSAVKEVTVMQSRIFTHRPTSDNAQLSIIHEDGTIGCVYCSFCVDDLQYYRCSFEINFENGTVYRNIGPADAGDEGKIVVEVATNCEGKLVTRRALFAPGGAGYQWENFYRAAKGENIGDTVSPEAVASVIKILEALKSDRN